MEKEKIKAFIRDLLSKMAVEFDEIETDSILGQDLFRIKSKESGKLIGSRGEVLRSINHVVKKTLQENGSETKFIIDVNDYKTRQIEDIQENAKLLADRALSLCYDVEMQPMTAYERMIVHATLADIDGIKTESQGEGRDRRLVIKYIA